eukprot:GHUV01050411.1.p1 GENE.GHUV01050411.1~~GHUV01050411.1.p1  ORF type:complete len:102 (+),score=26.15 GHUV01050411.1:52-357(+)
MKLNLVLFNDALLHLMRISRLMAMARGSGLLVGVGGSGKQSLARLAAYINGAYTFQITVTKVSYGFTGVPTDCHCLAASLLMQQLVKFACSTASSAQMVLC